MRLIDAVKVNETIDKFNYCLDEVMTCRIKMRISAIPTVEERPHGEWIDFQEDGYVECPFCDSMTECDGNKDELHYCFSCGAELS